ncbi:MAG: outer membrane beta-barrel protein [Janthinobacterium lividum]
MAVLLLSGPLLAQAQQAAVRGRVATPGGTAVELATVALHRAADSVVVKTEFSDAAGAFGLAAAVGQRYLVSVAQVGYARYWSPAFVVPAAGLELAPVVLAASQVAALQEVVVAGRKPLFEHQVDRTVVNVVDSPLSAGATTLDVLGRSPGVTTDNATSLALRGRLGLLVLVDGKRVPLTGSELVEYLRALPAEQVQRVELITNPPASYDAQGGAGVIAIALKKDQRLGTNGSANASYGHGEYGKFTGGLALNYRRKNLNLYGTYTYADRRGFTRVDFDRQYAASMQLPATSSQVASERVTRLRSHLAKVGLDLSLSKRTLLGVSVSGLASQTAVSGNSDIRVFDASYQPTMRYSSLVDQDIKRPNGSVNLNLRHAFADSVGAGSLAFDADYARYNTTRLLGLTTYFDVPTPATLLNGDQRSTLDIGAAKVDYSQPLPHRARLDAGAKVTRIFSDNTTVFVNTVNGVSTLNPNISSEFQYHENVNAAYAILSGEQGSTTLQAGLRAEQTNTMVTMGGGSSRERHYLQLFPSVLVQHTVNKQHALALAAARRIDRPSYGQLNPLRAYLDATSYIAGNPDLVASTSYNVELTHTYKQKFSTALGYSRTDQPIVSAVQLSPDGNRVVVNRDVNLTTRYFYTLTLTAPLELAKWWTLYANGLLYYNRYAGSLENTLLDRGQFACNLTLNNSFTLPHGWLADVSGSYDSRQVGGFQLLRAQGQVVAGAQKSLWHKQGTLRLNVSDIFYTTPARVTSTYLNFSEYFRSRTDSRVVTLALTYRFGNGKVAAARKRAAGADEELRRAASQ